MGDKVNEKPRLNEWRNIKNSGSFLLCGTFCWHVRVHFSTGTFDHVESTRGASICISNTSFTVLSWAVPCLGWTLSGVGPKHAHASAWRRGAFAMASNRWCMQPVRKLFLKVTVCSAHSSFYLNLCGLKFSFSPVSMFVLLDICCSLLFRVEFLLGKTQHFLILLLYNKRFEVTAQRRTFMVTNL